MFTRPALQAERHPGPEETGIPPGACCLLTDASEKNGASDLPHQPAPTVRVKVLASAVRTDEGTQPCAGSPVLFNTFQRVIAMRASQVRAVQLDSRLQTCGDSIDTEGMGVGSGHLGSAE